MTVETMLWLTRELRNNLHFVIHGLLYARWSIIYSAGPAICNITTAPPHPAARGDAVRRLAGRINCCVELRSQCDVTLLCRTLVLYLLQPCAFTWPSHIRTWTEKRFPARCQTYFRSSLVIKSGRQVRKPHGGPHMSGPFKDFFVYLWLRAS